MVNTAVASLHNTLMVCALGIEAFLETVLQAL